MFVVDTRFCSRTASRTIDRKRCRQRHRFLEPIHNVKEGANPHIRGRSREDLVFISGEIWWPLRRFRGGDWWSQPGSNRRPQACKASALPTELWPLIQMVTGAMVGRGGVEPPTSRLSGVRSNPLSYRPPTVAFRKPLYGSARRLGACSAISAPYSGVADLQDEGT